MRVLHAVLLLSDEPGIVQQLAWEREAAHDLGLPWDVFIFDAWSALREARSPWRLAPRAFTSVVGRFLFYRELIKRARRYDVILVRHMPFDPLRAWAIRKMDCLTGSVHHTKVQAELRAPGGGGAALRSVLEGWWGTRSLRRCDFVVGVTEEIAQHESVRAGRNVPALVYPNGCTIRTTDNASLKQTVRSATASLLFVSSNFTPWQGLDYLLENLATTTDDFTLHLVGNLSASDDRRARADRRIQVHGRLSAQEIGVLATTCWVGLSAFGLDRKDMTEACALKVREYLKYGLPVYAGYQEQFPEDFPFFRRGPANFSQILAYAESVKRVPAPDVLEEAAQYIDKKGLLGKLYSDMQLGLGFGS